MALNVRLDYEYLLMETVGEISNRALGLLIRGLSWSAEYGKDYISHGVLFALDEENADEDIEALIAAGVLTPVVGRPRRYLLTHTAWRVRDAERTRVPLRVRRAVFEASGHACASCGTGDDLTIDHITPVSKGGTNDPHNLQVLCQPCNSRKRDRV